MWVVFIIVKEPGCDILPLEYNDFYIIEDFFSFSKKSFFPQAALPPVSVPRPSANSQPVQARSDQGCGEYQTSGGMLYQHQSYPDSADSVAYTSGVHQPTSSALPFIHPLPCHKYSYCTAVSVTPTVITHTASTVGAQGFGHQTPSHHHTGDLYQQTPCVSLGYPSAPLPMPPPVTVADCFSVPQQMAVEEVKGKHKQKTGGLRRASPSGGQSGPSGGQPRPSAVHAPTPTLAQLLSSGSRDRELFCAENQTHIGR